MLMTQKNSTFSSCCSKQTDWYTFTHFDSFNQQEDSDTVYDQFDNIKHFISVQFVMQ